MAGEAPFHLQGNNLPDRGHLIHSPVTGGATHTLAHVDTVIEIDEIRKLMDTNPGDGLVGLVTFPDWLQIRTIAENQTMAVHACFRGWHAGKCGSFHRGVAVTAVDPIIGHMMLVAELDRLFDFLIRLGNVGRALVLRQNPKEQRQKK